MPRRLTRGTNRQPFSGHSARWHKERQDRVRARRDPVIQALYATAEWRALRAEVCRAANYICASSRCPNKATIADHLKPHRGAAALFFDRANLQALCKRCHDRKTARLDGGFGNPLRTPITELPQPGRVVRDLGTASRGARIQGGDFEFSGPRRAARLLSRLRAKPHQENGNRARNPDPLASSGRDGMTRLTSGSGLTARPRGPGAGAPNHPPAPVKPQIRNRIVKE